VKVTFPFVDTWAVLSGDGLLLFAANCLPSFEVGLLLLRIKLGGACWCAEE
jgi:hypothetical protein